MSLAITIVTTANRTRRFFQTDPARVAEILESLRRCGQLFSSHSLVIVADEATEVFQPKAITRIEIETQADLGPWLPPAWDEAGICALPPDSLTGSGSLDDEGLSSRMDFYFEGGDMLHAWIERRHEAGFAERTSRLTHLFDKPCIPYRPLTPGVGFINPAALTRFTLGVAATQVPAGAWHLSEA
jgi:hypothetical protein